MGIQYLYILLMVSFTFQISGQIPLLRRHYIFWLVGFGFAFYYAKKYLSRPASLAAIAYLFMVWFNFLLGDGFFGKMMGCLEETICIIIPATMLYYLYSRNDKRLFYWMLIVFSVFLVESTIVSFWADSLFPGIMRHESNKEEALEYAAILEPFQRIGLSSYALPHALPIIIPALVYLIRKSSFRTKILWIALLSATLVMLYVSGSTTAFLMGLLTLLFALIIGMNNKKGTTGSIVVVSVLLIPLIFSQDLQLWVVQTLQAYVPDDSVFTRKLVDIEFSILYGDTEGTVEARSDLYQKTFDTILENPILGTNEGVGGHSAIPDRFGALGAVGFIPFMFFLYYQIKYTIRSISKDSREYYYIGLLAGLLMMSVKGMFGWEMWFCLIVMLPGILWWSDSVVK